MTVSSESTSDAETESLEDRLKAFADDEAAFGEAVLKYYRDGDETLPPHHLLVTLRQVDDVALHFDSGVREWVLTANVDDGEAYYRFYDEDDLHGSGTPSAGEPRKALELEGLFHRELPELVDVHDTPLADGPGEVWAGP